jgi:hypothetical protein
MICREARRSLATEKQMERRTIIPATEPTELEESAASTRAPLSSSQLAFSVLSVPLRLKRVLSVPSVPLRLKHVLSVLSVPLWLKRVPSVVSVPLWLKRVPSVLSVPLRPIRLRVSRP